MPVTINTLMFGDNLNNLRVHVADALVDLIYLDPPFNSDQSFNVPFRDRTEAARQHKSRRSPTSNAKRRRRK
jgi:16S rRNA G966 N2-methylase RsmD